MRIKDFKISTKLFTGFGAIICITVVFGLFAFQAINRIINQIKIANMTSTIVEEVGDAQAGSLRFIIYNDDEYYEIIGEKSEEVITILSEIDPLLTNDENKAYVDQLQTVVESYQESNTEYYMLQKDLEKFTQEGMLAGEDAVAGIKEVLDVTKEYIGTHRSEYSAVQRLYKVEEAYITMQDALINYEQFKSSPNGETQQILVNTLKKVTNLLTEVRPQMVSENTVRAIDNAYSDIENFNMVVNSIITTVNSQNENLVITKEYAVELLETAGDMEENIIKVSESIQSKSISALIIILIIIVFLGISVSLFVSRIITRPLALGVNFAKSISEGDLTQEIEIDQEDEVGQLVNMLAKMNEKLKDVIASVITGANNIANASQQISSTSMQLSEGANEQASSVEEVSSTMEEMASNIEQNDENASQTESISKNAQNGINEVSIKALDAVDANQKIFEKISIINDIAFQTNILALNAAVEAARAGEHGKGFAVVAAEVRKLAENSKKAAEEIVSLAQNSFNITKEAGEKLSDMLPEIEKTSHLVMEIAASSKEQSNGAQQINNAIQQLNSVTQQTAASSEELATSAEEMSSQAEQLRDIISFFKIDKNKTTQYFQGASYKSVKQNFSTNQKPIIKKSTDDEKDFESF